MFKKEAEKIPNSQLIRPEALSLLRSPRWEGDPCLPCPQPLFLDLQSIKFQHFSERKREAILSLSKTSILLISFTLPPSP